MADESTNGQAVKPESSWTIDVQRGLGWTIVVVFGMLLVALALRVIVAGAPADSLELLKQGFNALINIVMMVVGFFYGSSKSSQAKDDTQSKIVEKLTSTQPAGPPGPVAPVPSAPPAPWWPKLTDAERGAIETAAPNNPQLESIVTAMKAGAGTAGDLNYLVARGMLTQARATEMQAS